MNHKILYWIIALLIALNIFTIFMLWQDYQGFNKGEYSKEIEFKNQNKNNRHGFFTHELDLDNEQKEKFILYRNDHIQQMREISEEIYDYKKMLLSEAFSNNENDSVISLIVDTISDLQERLEYVNISHISRMKAICNPSQIEKLETVFSDMILKSRPLNYKNRKVNRDGRFRRNNNKYRQE